MKIVSKPEIVLSPTADIDWMSGSVGFGKVFENYTLFSAMSSDGQWSIGVGKISGSTISNPSQITFENLNIAESITPTVIKYENRFIMAFAGKLRKNSDRELFFAESACLEGPWHVFTRHKANLAWERPNIDFGPGTYSDGHNVFFFYSSLPCSIRELFLRFFRNPLIPTRENICKIGARKIGIIEFNPQTRFTRRVTLHPIPVNGHLGSPTESVYCPGYVNVKGMHLLFIAAATYSVGFPFRGAIYLARSSHPPNEWTVSPETSLVLDKSYLPNRLMSNAAFDSPDPVPYSDSQLNLYFSAMSRDNGRWHILRARYML